MSELEERLRARDHWQDRLVAARLRHRDELARYEATRAHWTGIHEDLLDRRRDGTDRRLERAIADVQATLRGLGHPPSEPLEIGIAQGQISRIDIRIAELRSADGQQVAQATRGG